MDGESDRMDEETDAASRRMGRLLVARGKLAKADLYHVAEWQSVQGVRFGEAAVALGLVTSSDVEAVLAEQFSYPVAPGNSVFDGALVAALNPQARPVEALRDLRSQLMLRYFNNPDRRVLPLVGVDKAADIRELTANLAIVFSQLGIRTLLLDANLREPTLHRLFGLSDGYGLSDFIAGRTDVVPLSVPLLHSLWILPGGTPAPNPQELLTHERYRNLPSQINESFDVILVNTAPLSQSLDAQIVAARAGVAVIVAKQDVTRMAALDDAQRRLRNSGVTVLGAALVR
jgi:receptor protein-tyrosine kinase